MVARLHLTGDWIARETGIRSAEDVRRILDDAGETTLRVDASNLGQWDSALIAFLKMLRDPADAGRARPVQIDKSGLPEPTRRLLALAVAGATDAAVTAVPCPSLATRVGEAYFAGWSRMVAIVALIGETTLRGAAAFSHRTSTRAVDVVQFVREAGAGALGIVAIVNGLVLLCHKIDC